MDESKRPAGYVPEPDLQGIQPLIYEVDAEKRSNGPKPNSYVKRQKDGRNSRMDAAVGSAIENDGYLEPHEVTPSSQRAANIWSRLKAR